MENASLETRIEQGVKLAFITDALEVVARDNPEYKPLLALFKWIRNEKFESMNGTSVLAHFENTVWRIAEKVVETAIKEG